MIFVSSLCNKSSSLSMSGYIHSSQKVSNSELCLFLKIITGRLYPLRSGRARVEKIDDISTSGK